MSDKINLLLELQELDIVSQEAVIVHGEKKNDAYLQVRQESIRAKLDESTLSRFDRLLRHGLGVVHEKNGMCSGCNLTIPVGDLSRIRGRKCDPICPHCGKFIALSTPAE